MSRRKRLRVIKNMAVYLILIGFSLISLYPLIWVVLGSLKSKGELYRNIWLWPQNPIFSNYVRAWTHAGIGQAFLNSIIITAGAVLLVLVIGSIGSFGISKLRFPGSYLILAVLILTMMIRPVYTSIDLFRLTKALGIIDTHIGLMLAYVATSLPLSLALFTAYFRAIPQDLEDAARIDGASWFSVFTRVVLPLSGPVISAVIIFSVLDAWNDLFLALVLFKGPGKQTIPVALASLIGQFYKDFPELFAGLSASVIPIIIIYLIFQRRFISGMLTGAIKG